MNVNINFFLAANPFIDAYVHSDFLGKLIFIGLWLLSIGTWILILYKAWFTYQAKRGAHSFLKILEKQKDSILLLDPSIPISTSLTNPFYELYLSLKKTTVELLNKNRFHQQNREASVFLSSADIQLVESSLQHSIIRQTQLLEKNLFYLSMIVSLAPFLGLLGTVWGILTTFSNLQIQGVASSNQAVLGGISLALATTVLGLVDAIPALIGYSYLKNKIKDLELDMENFSAEILASIEMQYRKVDVHD